MLDLAKGLEVSLEVSSYQKSQTEVMLRMSGLLLQLFEGLELFKSEKSERQRTYSFENEAHDAVCASFVLKGLLATHHHEVN